MKTITKLRLLIIVLAILTPVGLMLPEYFKAGGAWGEWGSDEIKELIGYIPRGLAKLSALWSAPIPDYSFKGCGGNIGYILSAIIGIMITVGIVYLAGKILGRK